MLADFIAWPSSDNHRGTLFSRLHFHSGISSISQHYHDVLFVVHKFNRFSQNPSLDNTVYQTTVVLLKVWGFLIFPVYRIHLLRIMIYDDCWRFISFHSNGGHQYFYLTCRSICRMKGNLDIHLLLSQECPDVLLP